MHTNLTLLHFSPALASYSSVPDTQIHTLLSRSTSCGNRQVLSPLPRTYLSAFDLFCQCQSTWTGQEGLAARLTSLAAATAESQDCVSDQRALDHPNQTLYNMSPGYSSEPTTDSYFRVFISCSVPSFDFFRPPSPLPGCSLLRAALW